MTPGRPPRSLEWMLMRILPARDSETVSGDLFEEYWEERLPRLGRLRANYWYARQVAGFAAVRILWGPIMRKLLFLMSLFTIASGSWLAVMENVLKHHGYAGRVALDVLIIIQGLATLTVILFRAGSPFRIAVSLGAAAIAWVGVSAISQIWRSAHFEGYILVIGSALVAQAMLTIATLLRPTPNRLT